MAIGELMALQEEGQLYCMGFAAFSSKYHHDEEFKKWFLPIEKGITLLVDAKKGNDTLATYRLRRLQHLLIDLVLLLDQDRVATTGNTQLKVDAAHDCVCSGCPGAVAIEQVVVKPTEKLPEP